MKRLISILILAAFCCNIILPSGVEACWFKTNNGLLTKIGGALGWVANLLKNHASFSEPVYLHNGEYLYRKRDIFIPGRGYPLEVVRTYRSQSLVNGAYGYGWTLNYHQRIVEQADGSVVWYDGSGNRHTFAYLDWSNYLAPKYLYDTLRRNGDGGWTITGRHKDVLSFNPQGCLVRMSDRNGNALVFEYTAEKKAVIASTPYIKDVMLRYRPQLRGYEYQLVRVGDAAGRSLEFSYDGTGHVNRVRDYTGREVVYGYNEEGDQVSVTYPAADGGAPPPVIRYSYTGHNLEAITDAQGQMYLQNFYDAEHRVQAQSFGGITVYFSYNSAARTTEVRDGAGNRAVYTFNEDGLPVRKEQFTRGLHAGEPASYVTTYEYNGHMEQITERLPGGPSPYRIYDERGNVLSAGLWVGSLRSDQLAQAYTYESRYNFVKTARDANGYITTYYYDYEEAAMGDVNADGVTNQDKGNVIKITYPAAGGVTAAVQLTYNAYGQVLTATDPHGNKAVYRYDAATGYLTGVTRASGSLDLSRGITYDSAGNVKSISDPNGAITTFDYDRRNNLIKTTAPAPFGYTATYGYDKNDNLIQVDRQSGDPAHPRQRTAYGYDMLDRVVSVTDDLGNKTEFGYDANGNRESVKDAEGNITRYEYDERDLLWRVRDAAGVVTEYSYLGNGRLGKITDGKGNAASCTWDGVMRLSSLVYADGSKEAYTYDRETNILSLTDPQGQKTTYTYDALNRLTKKTWPDARTVSYTYDAGSRLKTAVDAAGTITYAYDAADRVTQVTYPGATAVQYAYDKNSNRVKLTYPDNSSISYSYDPLNRLTAIKDQAGASIAAYAYDALSRRKSAVLANGIEAAYGYDYGNRLTQVMNRQTAAPAVKISQYDYTYDKAGNRRSMGTLGGTHSYSYDSTYQLKTTSYPAGCFASNSVFNYDALGNRNSVTAGSTTSYSVNNLNQYTSVGGAAHTHDKNGNLVGDGVWTYSYDYENRLTQAAKSGTSAAYKYDPFGRRIEKTVNGSTAKYIYDGAQIIAETDAAGAITAKYVYGPGIDEPVRMEKGGTKYYYHRDGLGSVTQITDANKAVQESYTYDVYGRIQIKNPAGAVISASAIGSRFTFTGREYDSETGLYYYRNRFYHPLIGRFISRDPMGMIDGPNLYSYCANNPVNSLDPYGLWSWNWEGARQGGRDVAVGAAVAVVIAGGIAVILPSSVGSAVMSGLIIASSIPLGITTGNVLTGKTASGKNLSDEKLSRLAIDALAGWAGLGLAAMTPRNLVVGKLDDLSKPGALRLNDYRLQWPDQGPPKLNWEMNSGLLREAMNSGIPIRDGSVNPITGALGRNTGFLRAERNLMQNHGWSFNPEDNYWYPPQN